VLDLQKRNEEKRRGLNVAEEEKRRGGLPGFCRRWKEGYISLFELV